MIYFVICDVSYGQKIEKVKVVVIDYYLKIYKIKKILLKKIPDKRMAQDEHGFKILLNTSKKVITWKWLQSNPPPGMSG